MINYIKCKTKILSRKTTIIIESFINTQIEPTQDKKSSSVYSFILSLYIENSTITRLNGKDIINKNPTVFSEKKTQNIKNKTL